MKVTWDAEAKALYVTIIEGAEFAITEDLTTNVTMDISILGQICGIEILNVELIPIDSKNILFPKEVKNE